MEYDSYKKYAISFVGVLVILFALTVMDIFEKRVFKERTLRKIELLIKKKDADIDALKAELKKLDVRVASTGFERNVNESNVKIIFYAGVTRKINIQKLSDALEQFPGVVAISVEMIE